MGFASVGPHLQHGAGRGLHRLMAPNNGGSWLLSDTLRLADYGPGHDDRAKVHQRVAGRLGPRYCELQLTQPADESWAECRAHAAKIQRIRAIGGRAASKPQEPPAAATGKRPARGKAPGSDDFFGGMP